jgi:Protein of unknown function (DUF1579)
MHNTFNSLIRAGALAASLQIYPMAAQIHAEELPASVRLALPGEKHQWLAPLAGDWNVEMKVWPKPGSEPIISTTLSATRKWVLGGRYLQEELTGTFAGNASHRLAFLSYNNLEERFELATIDTFEPGQMWYASTSAGEPNRLVLTGENAEAGNGKDPTGRKRSLRFEFAIEDRASFERIYVKYPGEAEFLFVEQRFTPKATDVDVLAEYRSGTFLENAVRREDGAMLITSYLSKTLELIETGKPARMLSRLSAHPAGILKVTGGFILSAHGTPFTEGPTFTKTQKLLLLDEQGQLQKSFDAPDARFLNGLAQVGEDVILVADSIAGVIWKIDAEAQTLTPWLRDPLLAPDREAKEARPGANGLKVSDDELLVSNSSRGILAAVKIGPKGEAKGKARLVAKTGPIDDFYVTSKGDILFTTHGAALKRLQGDGTINNVIKEGCDGCTAIVPFQLSEGKNGYAVLTTGSLLEGGKNPARVLFIKGD